MIKIWLLNLATITPLFVATLIKTLDAADLKRVSFHFDITYIGNVITNMEKKRNSNYYSSSVKKENKRGIHEPFS